jgi:hypothetical protein
VASINGGHKTVRLAKKKGGSSEFWLLFFKKEKKTTKFLRCSLASDFLNAPRPVLANRHRSHHSGGFATKREATMIIGKFQQQGGGYVGNVPAFAGPTLPVRIAPTDLKGSITWNRYPARSNGTLRFHA